MTTTINGELAALLDDENIFTKNGLSPDLFQSQVLQFSAKKLLVACGRQVGKTTAVSGLASQMALRSDDSLILICAPSERQVRELLRTVKRLFKGAGYVDEIANDAILTLELKNGSRIIGVSAAAADGLRGFGGVDLMIIDEAAFVDDALFSIAVPMTATNPKSKLILLSTPNGHSNFFARRWHDSADEWTRVRWTSEQCGRIDPGFLAAQRRELGERLYAQEFLAEFITEGNAVFDISALRIVPLGNLALHV